MSDRIGCRVVLNDSAKVDKLRGASGVEIDDFSIRGRIYVEIQYGRHRIQDGRVFVTTNGNLRKEYEFPLEWVVEVQSLEGMCLYNCMWKSEPRPQLSP